MACILIAFLFGIGSSGRGDPFHIVQAQLFFRVAGMDGIDDLLQIAVPLEPLISEQLLQFVVIPRVSLRSTVDTHDNGRMAVTPENLFR